jgi:TRAP-type C4-dicarboxylate transport system permease small subunit
VKRVLAAAVAAVATGAAWLVRGLIAAALLVLGWQVFMRSVLASPPSWSEEVALLAFTWAVLLAVACGVRDGIHVRMDLLLDRLPAPARAAMERLLLLATAFVGGYLAWAGAGYAAASADTSSAATAYPMPLLYASAVVCGVLILLFALERLLLGAPAPPA